MRAEDVLAGKRHRVGSSISVSMGPGTQAVHAHALAAVLDREGAGERLERAFRGGVDGLAARRAASAATELTFRITPRRCSSMPGSTARVQRSAPSRLTSICSRIASSSAVTSRPGRLTPALFTQPSMWPCALLETRDRVRHRRRVAYVERQEREALRGLFGQRLRAAPRSVDS